MNRIAIFISGRLNCYETDLYPQLVQFVKQDNLQIDLFCALNCDRTEYYLKAEKLLASWLKRIEYEIYVPPEDFHCKEARDVNTNDRIYFNTLSMFYNDKKAYKMIEEYSKQNNIHYKLISKFRADITLKNNFTFPFLNSDDPKLYCSIPPCSVFLKGNLEPRFRMVTDAFAFGTPEVMKHYCRTYDFLVKTMRERNYKYTIVFELTLTESFYNIVVEDFTPEECAAKISKILPELPYPRVDFECPYVINQSRREKRI